MALKTFNLDEEVYKEFSKYCKKEGISMSRKVENFLRDELERLKGKGAKKSEAVKSIKEALKSEEHSFSKYC